MKSCSYCGREVESFHDRCPSCGTEIERFIKKDPPKDTQSLTGKIESEFVKLVLTLAIGSLILGLFAFIAFR